MISRLCPATYRFPALSVPEAVCTTDLPYAFFLIIPVRILFSPQIFIMTTFIVANIPEFGCYITHMHYDIGIFR